MIVTMLGIEPGQLLLSDAQANKGPVSATCATLCYIVSANLVLALRRLHYRETCLGETWGQGRDSAKEEGIRGEGEIIQMK